MRTQRWILVVAALSSMIASAQVPTKVQFNARITDTAGAPVTGSHSVFVSLFAAPTGGTATWTESYATVAFTNDGLAFLELGTNVPLNTTVFDGTKLYLELTIDGAVMAPRLGLVSVPYAIRAGDSATLGGTPASGFATASHTHSYLPVGTTLSCGGTQKVSAISTAGNVTCTDDVSTSYTAGNGITIASQQISVNYSGSGTSLTAARSDHNHAGTYLPVGATLACPAGEFATALQANGSVSCLPESGDISSIVAGNGLTGGGTTGPISLSVAFAGTGVSTTAARSDHTHSVACPGGYTTHTSAGGGAPLCIKRVAAPNVTWNQAATDCFASHAGGELCTYSQLRVAVSTLPFEALVLSYWMADRVDDNWVLRVGTTNVNDFDEKIEIVATTVQGPGYYCCQRAQ